MTLRGTAEKILGDLEIEGKKKLLDEALYTAENGPEKEVESVSPDGPPDPGDLPDPGDPGGPEKDRRKKHWYDWIPYPGGFDRRGSK